MTQQGSHSPELRSGGSLCILCGTEAGQRFLYPGILKCPSCGFVFADVHISPAELRTLYQRNYFFGDEYLDYIEDKPTLQKNFKARIRTLLKYSSGGNLYEIGCAYGFFLELAQRHWNAEGCDISAPACDEARRQGFTVACGDFLDFPLRENHYDVVAMWDTIEHLARPDLYVQKASRLLRSGGYFCATTGDIGSTVAGIQKQRWRLIHPPTHLYYFDRASIGRLLAKSGFQIVHYGHCGFSRSARQMYYSLFVLNRETALRKKLYEMFKPVLGFTVYMNLFDILFVIARKT